MPVGAERHRHDRAVMPLEGEGFLPGPGVPHFHRLILTGGGEAFAVGAERHVEDTAGMPLEGEGFLPGRGVPHLHRRVHRRRRGVCRRG